MAPIIAQLILLDLKIAAPRLVSACRLLLGGLVLLYAIFLKGLYTAVILSSFIEMPVRLSPIHSSIFWPSPSAILPFIHLIVTNNNINKPSPVAVEKFNSHRAFSLLKEALDYRYLHRLAI